MNQPRQPIFVHSLFRSGSTYIFNCFRRAEEGLYTAFQEPLNEAVFFHRHDREELWRIGLQSADIASLRHPVLTRPYYAELCDLWPNWSEFAREDVPFARAFDTTPSDENLGLLRSIINDAPARPVIQECRSTFRALMIKQALGGVTIHLWRNPWDQWWSYKSTWYFDIAHQLFLMAEPRPLVLDHLRERIGFQAPPAGTLREQIAFLSRHRPTAEASYLTFYTLWLLSQISMHPVQDIEINIDQLAQNPAYRAATLEGLAGLGVTGLDFSDCSMPIGWFGPGDAAFFQPLEEEVHSWMLGAGYNQALLCSLFEKRHKFQPLRPKSGDAVITRDIERARALVRELENRGPQLVREAEAMQAHQIQTLHAAIAQHLKTIADASAERDALTAQLQSLRAEHNVALLAVSRLSAERDALAARETDLQTTLAALDSGTRELAAQNARHEEVIATLTANNKDLANRIDLMARDYKAELELVTREQQLALAETARAYSAQIDALRSSISWRASAPIRWASWAASRLLGAAKNLLRPVAETAMHVTRDHPWMKRLILAMANLVPPVRRKIDHFWLVRQRTIPLLKGEQSPNPD